jgi:hypothetical protein
MTNCNHRRAGISGQPDCNARKKGVPPLIDDPVAMRGRYHALRSRPSARVDRIHSDVVIRRERVTVGLLLATTRE